MSPFDEPNKNHQLSGEQLDHTPVDFGKYKGKSPMYIAEELCQTDYVRWAYENVVRYNRPVFCSEVLYKECGGKFKSAKEQAEAKKAAEAQKPNSYRSVGMKPEHGHPYKFDDMDDDIPF